MNINAIDEVIVRNIFADRLKGNWPKFGSPETKCAKCMFFGVACSPSPEYSGCYGGWKMEKE